MQIIHQVTPAKPQMTDQIIRASGLQQHFRPIYGFLLQPGIRQCDFHVFHCLFHLVTCVHLFVVCNYSMLRERVSC
jgi:hypothetical protein